MRFYATSTHFIQILVIGTILCIGTHATYGADISTDSIAIKKDSLGRQTLFHKIGNYFRNANKPKPHKKFDISFIGGPQYASTTQFGIAVMAAGQYRSDRNDTHIQPSNATLFGIVSTTGFYMTGIQGTHIFPQERYRLLYTGLFYSMPGYYWGIGYDAGNSSKKWSYLRLQTQLKVNFLFRITSDLYIGPMVSYNYIKGRKFKKKNLQDTRTIEDIINHESRQIGTTGAGISIVYDSRDVVTNAHKGIFLKMEQAFYPPFFGNKYDFTMTDIIFDYYVCTWKSGILAFDLHGQFNYGNVPWTMKSRLGGQFRMRGYYEGRYRDNNIIEAQLELRQHLWKRNGIAIWVAAGNVFNKIKDFDFSETLPNFGIGYRWEFKQRINLRIDVGFDKDFKPGFMVNINEAF